ncbi:helix-turn-helix domain-containing protein [Methylophilus sp. 13]|uniref:helix-turn-helix domain-containing protein n=1 Tax=Methylophilus sp. 13 TaxID=2781018 RepID=UPI0034CE4E68
MITLSTKEAAAFLHLHPTTLLDRTKSGEIPAAKIGKCWVFLQVDLIEYLRSKYSQQASQGDEGNEQCHSTNERTQSSIGSKSLSTVKNRYMNLLALPTANKRKSTKRSG